MVVLLITTGHKLSESVVAIPVILTIPIFIGIRNIIHQYRADPILPRLKTMCAGVCKYQ